MAKKNVKSAKKTVSKPAPKAKKAVSRPATQKAKPAPKSAQKPVKKAVKPAPKAKAKAAPKKPAPPATKTKAPLAPKAKAPAAKAAPLVKTKSAVPVAPAAKGKAPVQKPAPAKPLAAAPAPAPAPQAKPPKPEPLPPIDTSKLPKLPKGLITKRPKGKLAPGERRIVKTDVITHHIISDKPAEPEKKQKPEPPGKFVMEYLLHTPVSLLYDFLTTPNGLAEWFADGVDMKNDMYTFEWDGVKQNAQIVSAKLDSYIRLRWMDKPDGYYFEFRVEVDELTNEVSLLVTDFGESADDIATSRHLWETQIQRLMKSLGSY